MALVLLTAGCTANYNNNDQSNQELDNGKETNTDLSQLNDKIYQLTSYMEQPEIDYSLYEMEEDVKGLYLTAYTAGTSTMDTIVDTANKTDVNAVVIDIKNDSGYITMESNIPLVKEIGSDQSFTINNIEQIVKELKEQGIYTIARIVCFKDPTLAKAKPEFAIKNKDGSLWTYKGIPWLNPYNKGTWEYILDVCVEAAEIGFDEIQFDYIRFEATSKLNNADLGPESATTSRTDIILQFLDYANERLDPYGVELAADVFGVIITSEYDAKNLGQDYIEMAKRLDVICPMIYPSHYGPGSFGYKYPDIEPYGIIYGAMDASNKLYAEHEGEELAEVRPWLQAFTATWLGSGAYIGYGPTQMQQQIKAVEDSGWNEWLFWSPVCKYPQDAFKQK